MKLSIVPALIAAVLGQAPGAQTVALTAAAPDNELKDLIQFSPLNIKDGKVTSLMATLTRPVKGTTEVFFDAGEGIKLGRCFMKFTDEDVNNPKGIQVIPVPVLKAGEVNFEIKARVFSEGKQIDIPVKGNRIMSPAKSCVATGDPHVTVKQLKAYFVDFQWHPS